ncbi:MAG: TldD/PmbA family protein [Candidatus Heimdallarchaeota archaeon]
MLDTIQAMLSDLGTDYQEVVVRSHNLVRRSVSCREGELEETTTENLAGIGIRVLIDGGWGFASFSGSYDSIDNPAGLLRKTLQDATKISKMLSRSRHQKVQLAPAIPTVGKFQVTSSNRSSLSLEEMMDLALEIDKAVQTSSELIKSSGVALGSIREQKSILTLSGTSIEVVDEKSDLYVSAIATQNGRLESHTESVGITGNVKDLFRSKNPLELAARASNLAIKKLDSRIPSAGTHLVVLDPEIVGLLCHEAIGHTVEADFVLSGSIAKGKLGEAVASPEVTMIDSGTRMEGAGWLPVDDEGTKANETVLIEAGVLTSYLHNRETAELMDFKPTGNCRAGGYSREPIIRMTNTFIKPGDWNREEIIQDTKSGVLLAGAGSGEADANAEYVFDVSEAYPIKNGEVSSELLRGVAISGNAFETLKSVDAIGANFKLEMGAGACLKGGQPVKVDGGGPSLRCQVRIAGRNYNNGG